MNTKDQKPIYLDPEKLGIPPQKGDPVGMNEMIIGMYRKMSEAKPSRPLWIKIFSILLSAIALVLPGIFMMIFPLSAIFSETKNISGIEIFSTFITLLFAFALIGSGIKIIYSNTRSLFINHN